MRLHSHRPAFALDTEWCADSVVGAALDPVD
jgi:hypothetical protein